MFPMWVDWNVTVEASSPWIKAAALNHHRPVLRILSHHAAHPQAPWYVHWLIAWCFNRSQKWSLGDHLMVKILDILGRFGNHVSKDGNPMKSSHRKHSDHSTVLFVLRCIFGRPSFLVGRCWAPGYVQLSCWIEEALYELTRALNDYISRIFKWSGRPKHVDVDLQGRNIP